MRSAPKGAHKIFFKGPEYFFQGNLLFSYLTLPKPQQARLAPHRPYACSGIKAAATRPLTGFGP